MRAASTASVQPMRARESVEVRDRPVAWLPGLAWLVRCRYHRPTRETTAMPAIAITEHQASARCPNGATMNAATNGPTDDPTFPPTWNSDCASPCRPPDAIRAMRDDSGWNTDD